MLIGEVNREKGGVPEKLDADTPKFPFVERAWKGVPGWSSGSLGVFQPSESLNGSRKE